jgi:hypothetical protein
MTQFMASISPLVWLGRRFAARFSKQSDHDAEHAYQLADREPRITPILNQGLKLDFSKNSRYFHAAWCAVCS